jgi:hypothetical protein
MAAGGLVPSDSGLNGAASIQLYACVTVACRAVPIDSGAVSILYRFIHVLL